MREPGEAQPAALGSQGSRVTVAELRQAQAREVGTTRAEARAVPMQVPVVSMQVPVVSMQVLVVSIQVPVARAMVASGRELTVLRWVLAARVSVAVASRRVETIQLRVPAVPE